MRLSVLVLGFAFLAGGCASSGSIRGTLAEGTPVGLAAAQAADSARAAVPSSIVDAVVYVEKMPRGEAFEPTATGRARVELKDQEFRPRVLVVPVGASVDFTNNDTLFHDVFSVSPARRFDLGRRGGGRTRRVTFDSPGVVKVYCKIHSNMAAYILVVPTRMFARPDSSGHFALPPLPNGAYKVSVWHPDFPLIRKDVIVSGGKVTEVQVTLGP